MRRALALEVLAVGRQRALAHHGATDYECRPHGLALCLLYGIGDGHGVVAVDFKHVPVPRAVLGRIVLVVDGIDHRRQLHAVAVVEHYQVRKTQIARYAAGALRYLFLYAAVRDEGVGLVRHRIAETRLEKTLGYRAANRHRMSLAQWTRRILHTAFGVQFRMPRRHRTPLAELRQLVRSVVARKGKY